MKRPTPPRPSRPSSAPLWPGWAVRLLLIAVIVMGAALIAGAGIVIAVIITRAAQLIAN